MGIAEIAGLVFSLVATYGPKAKDLFDTWYADAGENPTEEQKAALKALIEAHPPESYNP